MSESSGRESWHLDKRVPISVIFAILAQTGVGIWWASSIGSQLAEQERRLFTLESESRRTTDIREGGFERLTRIEEQMKADRERGEQWRVEYRDRIARLEQQLDQVIILLRQSVIGAPHGR